MILTEQVKELSRKLQKEEERTLCRICYSREMNVVFLNCGHHALCSQCAEGLKVVKIMLLLFFFHYYNKTILNYLNSVQFVEKI